MSRARSGCRRSVSGTDALGDAHCTQGTRTERLVHGRDSRCSWCSSPSCRFMGSADAYGLGYRDVDGDPHTTVLVTTMSATAGWRATQRLRAWERQQLRIVEEERVLDVGCGRGEALISLGADLGTTGAPSPLRSPRLCASNETVHRTWADASPCSRPVRAARLQWEGPTRRPGPTGTPMSHPHPDGCFSMESLAEDLAERGQLESGDVTRFVAQIHEAARHQRFEMSLTMHAVVATRH